MLFSILNFPFQIQPKMLSIHWDMCSLLKSEILRILDLGARKQFLIPSPGALDMFTQKMTYIKPLYTKQLAKWIDAHSI